MTVSKFDVGSISQQYKHSKFTLISKGSLEAIYDRLPLIKYLILDINLSSKNCLFSAF